MHESFGQPSSGRLMDKLYEWPAVLDYSQEKESNIIKRIPLTPKRIDELSTNTLAKFLFMH